MLVLEDEHLLEVLETQGSQHGLVLLDDLAQDILLREGEKSDPMMVPSLALDEIPYPVHVDGREYYAMEGVVCCKKVDEVFGLHCFLLEEDVLFHQEQMLFSVDVDELPYCRFLEALSQESLLFDLLEVDEGDPGSFLGKDVHQIVPTELHQGIPDGGTADLQLLTEQLQIQFLAGFESQREYLGAKGLINFFRCGDSDDMCHVISLLRSSR